MKTRFLCLLLGVALGSLSFPGQAAPAPDVRGERDRSVRPRHESAGFDTQSASTLWRWIGLQRKAGACPKVDGWTARSLLDEIQERVDKSLEARDRGKYPFTERRATFGSGESGDDRARLDKSGLNRLCVYLYDDPVNKPSSPPRSPDLVKAEPDRVAVSTLDAGGQPWGDLGDQAWPILAAHFFEQTLGTASPQWLDAASPSVRLVFLDTQPDGDGAPRQPPVKVEGANAVPRSMHGYTLAHLARNLVCPDANHCVAEIATRLALSYDDFNPDTRLPEAGGGELGTASELAAAIVAEVQYWRRIGAPKHLILNLSIGWDGELFKDIKASSLSRLSPSAQAVYRALRYAADNDVLVIAAAGNLRGGQQESRWPVLPAAWESRRPSWFPFVLWWHKKIYAVGGVDWQSLPLPNSRPGGLPRRAAFGDHAVAAVASSGGLEPTAIYTGTSVSAAVASSLAAVVWHLRPDLEPRQVMRLITRSGSVLDLRADYYGWKPLSFLAPKVRRLSFHRAVSRACGPGGARCPRLLELREVQNREAQLTQILQPPLPPQLDFSGPPLPLAPPCKSRQLWQLHPHQLPPVPCPTDELGGFQSQRWMAPQPTDTPCSGCALIPPPPSGGGFALSPPVDAYVLTLQIPPAWRAPGITIDSAVLEVHCNPGSKKETRRSFAIPLPETTAKTTLPLSVGQGSSLAGCTAALSFKATVHGKTLSIQNPVYVDP